MYPAVSFTNSAPAQACAQYAAANGVEFVAMEWGLWPGFVLGDHIAPGVKAVQSFNEPNHRSQANVDPQAAAVSSGTADL